MAAMPFESSLVVLTMTGAPICGKMFDHGISKFTWYGDPEGSFLQVSGMRVTYNFSFPRANAGTDTLQIVVCKTVVFLSTKLVLAQRYLQICNHKLTLPMVDDGFHVRR
uniref:Putative 5'-nucleotidase/ apyrase isoform 1 n=1 Tax=Ixodes ricinus TaxID=34613 RepID=V5H3R0_IXORI